MADEPVVTASPQPPASVQGDDRRLDDEQGNKSASRLYLAFALPFAGLVLVAEVVLTFRGARPLPNVVYSFMSGVIGWLIVWAAGPRIAQYIAPSLQGVSAGIGAALQRLVGPGER